MNAAITAARDRSRAAKPTDLVGYCLRQVRQCLVIGPGADDAIGAWNAAKRKVRVTDPTLIPRGVPVFWSGGSEGHGHIALACGYSRWQRLRRRPVYVWSTDIERPGYFDRVPLDLIAQRWGLTFLGYTLDLNGQDIPQ